MTFLEFLGMLLTGFLGLAFAVGVSLVLAMVGECLYEKFGSTCPVGGSGVMMWCFIAIPFEVIGLVVGMCSSATGWALFLYPMWAMLIAYALFGLLSLFASSLTKD